MIQAIADLVTNQGKRTLRNQRVRGSFFQRLALLWCRLMHHSPMWAGGKFKECRICGRVSRVEWSR